MILRDPVHGLVSFENAEESIIVALLEAREVQRLRRVRQMGLASLAYPGADHTRFSHALGAAHVMTRLIRRLRAIHEDLPFWQRLTTERARDALAASLLHDVGHGPFSHLFEATLASAFGVHADDKPGFKGGSLRHEDWTRLIVLDPASDVHRILARFDPALPGRVAALVDGDYDLNYLARAVSGTFDVDRCDYLLRDAHFTGVGYGKYDLDWLLRSLCFGPDRESTRTPESGHGAPEGRASSHGPPLAIDGAKGIQAIESFLLARLFMFQQVYFHKTERASEWMLARIFERLYGCILDGARIPAVPPALVSSALSGTTTLGDYLALDDGVLWVLLAELRESSDPILADLSRRVYARHLFKTLELFGAQASPRGRLEALDTAREIAERRGFDPQVYVGLDAPSTVAFDDREDPLAVVFPGGTTRPLAEVSFLLGRLFAQKVERVRLVFAGELRDEIQRALAT